jgi:hypothetical protein
MAGPFLPSWVGLEKARNLLMHRNATGTCSVTGELLCMTLCHMHLVARQLRITPLRTQGVLQVALEH